MNGKVSKSDIIDFTTSITYDPPISSSNAWVFTKKTSNDAVSYNLEVDISANSGSSSRAATITLTQATTGKVITITITQKAVDIPMYVMSLYDAQGLFYGCDREYSQAINYKIDTVDPSDWTPSGSYSHGSITVKKGNLSPSDFSGGILIELILGNKINGYVKRVMLRIKIN